MTVDTKPDVQGASCIGPCDCTDLDDECPEVLDKIKCWLYAPERGMCPYLRATNPMLHTRSVKWQ